MSAGGIVAWVALALALAPVLGELASHAAVQPWAAAPLALAFLLARLAQLDRAARTTPAPRVGTALLVLGAVLLLSGVGGGEERIARLALPLGVAGLGRLRGDLSARSALLALWLLPLPSVIGSVASPGLERLWLELAALLLSPLAGEATRAGSSLVWPTLPSRLLLGAADGGVALAWTLAGVGVFTGLRCASRPAEIGCRALRYAAAAIVLQASAVVAAASLVIATGSEALASLMLGWGVVAIGLAGALAQAQRVIRKHRSRG